MFSFYMVFPWQLRRVRFSGWTQIPSSGLEATCGYWGKEDWLQHPYLLGGSPYHLWREHLVAWHQWGNTCSLFIPLCNQPPWFPSTGIIPTTWDYQCQPPESLGQTKMSCFSLLILFICPSSAPEIYNFTLWKVLWIKRIRHCERWLL